MISRSFYVNKSAYKTKFLIVKYLQDSFLRTFVFHIFVNRKVVNFFVFQILSKSCQYIGGILSARKRRFLWLLKQNCFY